MKKLIVIGIVAVVLVLGGIFAKTSLLSAKDDADESSQVETAKVERGDISEVITATGTIEPLTIIEVSSKASGKIIKMSVDKGDFLNEGDVIAEIEQTYAQNDVDQAEADLSSANARLEQAKINIELEREHRKIQLAQAEVNLSDAQLRLAQLDEQLKQEKEANARKLDEAKNSLKIAQLQLKLLSPEAVRPEALKKSKASIAQAQANLELAQKDFDRQKDLYENGGYIPKAELDSAKTRLDADKAQYDSAQQQLKMVETPSTENELELSQANVDKAKFALQAAQENIKAEKTREKELDMQKNKIALMESNVALAKVNLDQVVVKEKDLLTAQATVSRNEIQLKNAKEKLDDTLVTAPITGTILDKNVEQGQIISSKTSSVAAEGAPLVTMADLTKIYVNTDVDETDIGKVKTGQSVKIEIDAFPGQPFEGKVLKIAPQGQVTQNVTTFEVTTEILGKIDLLKPGMNSTVEIIAADEKNVLLVPNETIIDGRRGKVVRVVGEDRPRSVKIGVSNWEKTQIISGLEEGETVIIGGNLPSSRRENRFLERMKQDPSSGVRMMQGGGRGRGGGGPR